MAHRGSIGPGEWDDQTTRRMRIIAEHGSGSLIHPTLAAMNSLAYQHWHDIPDGGEPTEDQDQALLVGLEELIKDLQGWKRRIKKRLTRKTN